MSRISGILPVDKPSGPTSHDVVARARRALEIRRIGHTGTLDPFASGLLILCVGPATRLAEYVTRQEKEYDATAVLGVGTTTHDTEGEVVSRSDAWRELTPADVEAALDELRGPIIQRPPVFSAKKVGGEPAHRRVRRGEEVELAPVEVTVHELVLRELEGPRLRLGVRCSSGTYVRALARDLGAALGVDAHLVALRRTGVGGFSVEEAMAFGDLEDGEATRRAVLPPLTALEGLPRVQVDHEAAKRLTHGQALDLETRSELPGEGPVAVILDDRLVAVGLLRGTRLRPRKVFFQE